MIAPTPDRLHSIVARAASPPERRTYRGFTPRPGQEARNDSRVRHWIDGVTAGNPEFLQAVLASRHMTESDLRASLADVQVTDTGDLPEWVGVLAHLLDDVAAFEAAGWRADLPGLRHGDSLAFDALLPFVSSGAVFLDGSIGGRALDVGDVARTQLLRILESRLLSLTMHVLDDEVRTGAAVARMWGRSEATSPGGGQEDWLARFDRYPVLGRLVALTYRNWSRLVEELLDRLVADRSLLETALFGSRPLGALVDVAGDAGDLHDQGRAVAILTFEGGRRVVYKPKDLRVAARFQELVEVLNQQGLSPPLPVRSVIPRGPYAWEEFVADGPCRSEAELTAFYVRLGMFIRLLQLLGARDFWFDNVIAAGPMPTLIDLETVIQQRPRVPPARLSAAELAAYDALEESAVNIGLIAHCTPIAEGAAAEDIGAMTPPRRFTTPFHFDYSEGVGRLLDPLLSDDGFVQWHKSDYAPTLNGDPVDASDHFDAVAEGYRTMQRHLLDHRSALASEAGPLAALGSVPVRHIQRDTWSCMQIISNSLRSAVLVDGLRRERFLEGLLRSAALDGSLDVVSLRAVVSEVEALRDLDIPLFQTLPGESRLLLRGGGAVAGFFASTAMDRVWRRLSDIHAVGVDEQLDLMRSSLSTGAHPPRRYDAASTPATDTAPVDVPWLERAVELADLILAGAVTGPDGGLAWLGVTSHPSHGLVAVEVLRPDILTGTGGLAMLFSDLHRATGLPRYAEAARGSLASSLQVMADAPGLFAALRRDPTRSDSLACGRWYGIGSQIHAVRSVADGLADPELAERAADYAAGLDLDEVVRRAPPDLMGGVAGLLSVLLPQSGAPERPSPAALRLLDDLLSRLDRAGAAGAHPYPASRVPLDALPDGVGGLVLALDQARPFTDGSRRRRVDEWRVALAAEPTSATAYQQLLVRLSTTGRATEGCLSEDAEEFLAGDLRRRTSRQLLEVMEIALDTGQVTGAHEPPARARAAAQLLCQRHAATGSWFPESHAADRHNLSLITGVAAVAHAFLRCHDPVGIGSVRTST